METWSLGLNKLLIFIKDELSKKYLQTEKIAHTKFRSIFSETNCRLKNFKITHYLLKVIEYKFKFLTRFNNAKALFFFKVRWGRKFIRRQIIIKMIRTGLCIFQSCQFQYESQSIFLKISSKLFKQSCLQTSLSCEN